jgi:hypothetical protein
MWATTQNREGCVTLKHLQAMVPSSRFKIIAMDVQVNSGTHPEKQWPGHKIDHSHPASDDINNALYVFITFCLIEQRDNSTFSLSVLYTKEQSVHIGTVYRAGPSPTSWRTSHLLQAAVARSGRKKQESVATSNSCCSSVSHTDTGLP